MNVRLCPGFDPADKSQRRTAVVLHHIQLGHYSYPSIIKSGSFIISDINTEQLLVVYHHKTKLLFSSVFIHIED